MRQFFLVYEQHGGGAWDWSKGLREQACQAFEPSLTNPRSWVAFT